MYINFTISATCLCYKEFPLNHASVLCTMLFLHALANEKWVGGVTGQHDFLRIFRDFYAKFFLIKFKYSRTMNYYACMLNCSYVFKNNTAELQWLELVYHGCFELVLESLRKIL